MSDEIKFLDATLAETMPTQLFLEYEYCKERRFLVTKKPEELLDLVPSHWVQGYWPRNISVGRLVKDQRDYDDFREVFQWCPADEKFVVLERPVNLKFEINGIYVADIDAVIMLFDQGQHGRAEDDMVLACKFAGVQVIYAEKETEEVTSEYKI